MSFLGKMLVVLQLVLSVVFMAFAGAVVAVQTNWRTEADNRQDRVTELTRQLQEKETEFEQFKTAVNLTLGQQRDRADQAEGENTRLKEQIAILDERNKDLATAHDSSQELARLNTEEATARRREVMAQRVVNEDLHKSREELVAEVRSLGDNLFSREVKMKQMTERQSGLLRENADLKTFLRQNGLEFNAKAIRQAMAPPPENVFGKVIETRQSEKTQTQLVELSIGSDDGISAGTELFVYRGDKYLGDVRVVYTAPDRAVGTVVRTTPNSTIEKGDNVTTKL